MKKFRPTGLLFVCLLFLCSCNTRQETIPELLDPVQLTPDTAIAEYNEIFDLKYYMGTVYAASESAAFPLNGRISEIAVSHGQAVTEGEVLATLDTSSLQEEISACQKNIVNTQKEATRTNRQQEIDLELLQIERSDLQISGADAMDLEQKQIEIEQLQLNIQQTKATQARTLAELQQSLTELNARLADYTLSAPCDGIVVWISEKAQPGLSISSNDTLFYLLNPHSLSIETEYISSSNLEQASSIYAMIGSSKYDITPVIPDHTEVIASFLAQKTLFSYFTFNTPNSSVAHGDAAILCLVSNYKENVLCVPSNAIFRDAEGTYVYQVQHEQRIRTPVTIGIQTTLRTEILSGLLEGDEVYVQG